MERFDTLVDALFQKRSSGAAVSGALYDVKNDDLFSIEGTLSGTTLSATAGDAIVITAQYTSNGLIQRVDGSLQFNATTYNLLGGGCWLHP